MIVLNDLLKYSDLKIYQDSNNFKFSLDSILLPNFISIKKNTKNILDIGTGYAPIPLILSKLTIAKITAVEIQKEVAELAKKTVLYNRLDKQIEIINADIRNLEISAEYYDIVTCNPPYYKITSDKYLGDNEAKLISRHEKTLTLEMLIKIAARALKNNGVFGLVHRPERLTEIIQLCHQYHLEIKKIQFVYPRKGKNANIVLIEAVKNGNSETKILEPLFVYEDDEYTEQIKRYFIDRKEC